PLDGESSMQLGMVGLGRMGANMVRRLMRAGHACVVYDHDAAAVAGIQSEGARGVASLSQMVATLAAPRIIWLMVPAAAVEPVLRDLRGHLAAGDIVIDGGNSSHRDDIHRADELASLGIRFVDVGTSGGVLG